jgi:hypothetical protein
MRAIENFSSILVKFYSTYYKVKIPMTYFDLLCLTSVLPKPDYLFPSLGRLHFFLLVKLTPTDTLGCQMNKKNLIASDDQICLYFSWHYSPQLSSNP